MAVEVDNRTAERPDEVALAALIDDVLDDQGASDGEVALILVAPGDMQALNREYRMKDEVTDVLAFPLDGREELPLGLERQLGDVVVCSAQAVRQAGEAGVAPLEEMRTLVVHGLLHLLGHDHEIDAGEMLVRQDELRAVLPPLS